MNLALNLATLAVRKLVDGACTAVGIGEVGEVAIGVVAFLNERFTDHSQRLTVALQHANERAWRSLELSLAGESLMERCKAATARTEDMAFARQVRAFLDAAPLPQPTGKSEFRQQCLTELRAARQAKLLTGGVLQPKQLAEQAGAFARFSDPQSRLEGDWRVIESMARELKEAGYANLAWVLVQRPAQGDSILVAGARYFFRRAVENDQKLFQGLAFSQLERLGKDQEQGFACLHAAMAQQGQRLEELLADVHAVVVETHSAVLDLQGQIEGQSGHIQQIGQAVQKLLEQHQLHRREVRPGDSLSIRNDNERQLVKQLVARYRALPDEERRQMPALLNGIGKLEVVAGDFDAAQKDFQSVALLEQDNKGKAEAHYNAYRVYLEKRDWPGAIQELVKAVRLDGKRFAPFPVGTFQPIRILGAGGFGIAFLCKHKYMDAQVVVKTLMLEDLGRDADKVFTEAQVLRQLDHPAIIRISDCGYVDAASKSRPFLVMDYFPPGITLEDHVKKHGPLAVEDLSAVARQVGEGLHVAHAKGILHRDVKPANLLIRKEEGGWRVKVIDFGLALRQKVVQTSMNASTSQQSKTLLGDSIAGTLDYAAPEQMGKRAGEPVGPYSDVYGWAKTCCYALFQTTQPLMKHWQSIPQEMAELLEKCLDENPKQRPQSFKEVLTGLHRVNAPIAEPLPSAEQWFYARNGKQTGPISFDELVAHAQTGNIEKTDMVWTARLGSWVQAGSIPRLSRVQPPTLPPVPAPPHIPIATVGNSVKVQFVVPPGDNLAHMAGKAIRGYVKLATYGLVGGKVFGSDVLKFYHNHKLLGEGSLLQGFTFETTFSRGRYQIVIAHWVGNNESDRKDFDLSFDKPGEYQIRFNYVRAVMGGMSGSTIEILKEPV